MTLRFRPSLSSLRTACVLVLALASGAACTAIFAPRDSVQRCGTGDDCEQPDDARYSAVCRFDPENSDLDSTKVDKICVADFKTIDCTISTNPEDPDAQAIDDCEDLMLDCDADRAGSEGCQPPNGGSCNDGLELNDFDICVDPDSDEIIVSGADNRDFAIQDQICKGFFCDERFVCDNSGGSTGTCVICDPELPFGEGGCGTFYANGAPAPFYVLGDDLEDRCAAPDSDTDEPILGECP
jgi:hypothetical protein